MSSMPEAKHSAYMGGEPCHTAAWKICRAQRHAVGHLPKAISGLPTGATWKSASPRWTVRSTVRSSTRPGGYPGGVCQCPHYFYLFEGRIRCLWPGTDIPEEVVSAGEVCFFSAGHVLIYDEASRVLELNPASALHDCMDAVERVAQQ